MKESNRPFLIGVLVEHFSPLGRGLLSGFSSYFNETGAGRFMVQLPWNLAEPAMLRELPLRAILAQVQSPQMGRAIADLQIPSINLSTVLAETGLPTVGIDDEQIGSMAARHFLARGFRHFAYLGATGRSNSQTRGAAFEATAQSAAQTFVRYDVDLRELYAPGGEPANLLSILQASGATATLSVLARWIRAQPRPLALFAYYDPLAALAIQACTAAGLSVPENVAIVGAGNYPTYRGDPGLSTVEVSGEQVGYRAAQLLDRMMTGEAPPAEPVRVLPVGLIIRKSSDTRAVDDPDVAEAIRFIRENAGRSIGVRNVVAAAAILRRTLERRFLAVVGHTPLQEITRTRIERAKRLLVETALPVRLVARECGYENVSQFCQIFRKSAGRSPSGYRRDPTLPT